MCSVLCVSCWLLSVAMAFGQAQTLSQRLIEAGKFYEQGDYREAEKLYWSAIDEAQKSAPV